MQPIAAVHALNHPLRRLLVAPAPHGIDDSHFNASKRTTRLPSEAFGLGLESMGLPVLLVSRFHPWSHVASKLNYHPNTVREALYEIWNGPPSDATASPGRLGRGSSLGPSSLAAKRDLIDDAING